MLVVLVLSLFMPWFSQINQTCSLDPDEYFGDSYIGAVKFCRSNKNTIISGCQKYGIDPAFAISLVFPEIIRYDRFSNFIETSALELVYLNGGSEIADFSIGHFQMKPSFAEKIEKQISMLPYREQQQFKDIVFKNPDSYESRKERLEKLNNLSGQLAYLAAFIKVTGLMYQTDTINIPGRKLILYAAAYNRGIGFSYQTLIQLADKKSFPYGTNLQGRFSYTDVALYFFRKHSEQIFNPHLSIKE